MDNIKFSEMTINEIKDYFSIVACQNYNQIRDYIFLHFFNSKEVTKKSILAKRIYDRYNATFKPELIASVIKTYIDMGILVDNNNGSIRIAMQDDRDDRDKLILEKREKQELAAN